MEYFRIFLIIFASSAFLPESAGAKRNLAADITGAECNIHDLKIIPEAECWLVTRPKSTAMANIRFELLQDLTNLTVKYHVSINSSGKYTDYLKGSLDACVALQQYYTNFLGGLIMRELRRVGNLPLACPYKKQAYAIRNFTLDQKYFPAFLPNLDWKCYLEIWSYDKMIADMTFFGTVRR